MTEIDQAVIEAAKRVTAFLDRRAQMRQLDPVISGLDGVEHELRTDDLRMLLVAIELPGQCRSEGKCHHPAPAAMRPAEPTPAQKRMDKLMGDPKKAAALDRARRRIAVELETRKPAEPDTMEKILERERNRPYPRQPAEHDEDVGIYEDAYDQIAGMLRPYADIPSANGTLPGSVVESYRILLDHWLSSRPAKPTDIDMEVVEDHLRDMARSAYQTTISFGVSQDGFERFARDVFAHAHRCIEGSK